MKWFKRNADGEREQLFRDRIHVVRSEEIDNTYYWYDADSGEFIAQGRTDEEIRTVLRQCWQDHVFVISDRYMVMGPDFDCLHEFDPKGAQA